ncbi:phosphate ABC transporter substrate-binding protein [Gorillibacterium sp. sgz5001074]|uniref:phosphate ABC transporter substrate-binding protein n=1 Tax=Gorillibacterium sp. sgz5001074 TaxID=3446695 RepID=UPI003F67EC10
MSKKMVSLALASVMMMGVLAACGDKDEKTTGSSASPAATTATSPAASAAASAKPAAPQVEGTASASGSSALLPLVKAAAEDFMAKNPKATINVTGGGSGTGLKNVADGTSDIGNSDVAAGDEYKDKGLVDHIVAVAPFAIIVNNDVNVDNLTKAQAQDIFSGKITNWKDVGGKDLKITVVHRPDSSGSRKLVQQIVMGDKSFTKDGIQQAESGAMKTSVATTSGAIGYIDTPYIDNTLKAVKFEGVAFSADSIKDGKYPLFGQEHMYTKGEPKGAVKAFIDYIMSDDFQKPAAGKTKSKVEELGFLPASLLKK